MQGVMAQQMQQNEVLKNIMEMVQNNKEGEGECISNNIVSDDDKKKLSVWLPPTQIMPKTLPLNLSLKCEIMPKK